ncbi:hypothetical protein C1X65_19490 [Pseudomonas sp. FW305-70]|nr:hypothetical protein C1X65_19490 [Pseudomonas sp. FW305-70]
MLAENQNAPWGVWVYALSLTTIASKLAPAELVLCPTIFPAWALLLPYWNNDGEMADGLVLRTNPDIGRSTTARSIRR